MSSERRKHKGEEQTQSVGFEHRGPIIVGSKGKCTRLNPCVRRRVDLSKSRSLEVNKNPRSSRVIVGERSEFLSESTLGETSVQELKLLNPEDPKRIEAIISRGRHASKDRVFRVKSLQEKRVHMSLKLLKPE
jgi:hypothetical protein